MKHVHLRGYPEVDLVVDGRNVTVVASDGAGETSSVVLDQADSASSDISLTAPAAPSVTGLVVTSSGPEQA